MPSDVGGGIQVNVAVDSSAAEQGLKRTAQQMQNLQDQARRAGGSVQRMGQDVSESANAMLRAHDAGQGLASTLKQIATIAVGVSLSNKINQATHAIMNLGRESLSVASRAQEMDVVLANLGSRAGYTAKDIERLVTQVKDMGITTGVAQQAISEAFANNLDPSIMPQLARVAQDAAVLSKADSSQTLERIIIGITRQNSLILRNAGLTVMAGQAISDYADELGVATDSLDSTQRIQAVLNAVLKEGQSITGTYTSAMETAGKQQRSLARHIEETHEEIGGYLIPAYTEWIQLQTRWWKGFQSMVSEGGSLTPLLEGVREITLQMTDFLNTIADDESMIKFKDALVETANQFVQLAAAAAPAIKLMSLSGLRGVVAILTPIITLLGNLAEMINNNKIATDIFTGALMALAAVKVVDRISNLVGLFIDLAGRIKGARVEAEALAAVEGAEGATSGAEAVAGGVAEGVSGGWAGLAMYGVTALGTAAIAYGQRKEAERQARAAEERAQFEAMLAEQMQAIVGNGSERPDQFEVEALLKRQVSGAGPFADLLKYWSENNPGRSSVTFRDIYGNPQTIAGREALTQADVMNMLMHGDTSFMDTARSVHQEQAAQGWRGALRSVLGGGGTMRDIYTQQTQYVVDTFNQVKWDAYAPWRSYLAQDTAAREARDEEIRQQNEIGGVQNYTDRLNAKLNATAQAVLGDSEALWSDIVAGWGKAGQAAAAAFTKAFSLSKPFEAAYQEAVKKKKGDPGGAGTKALMEQITGDKETMENWSQDYKAALAKGLDPAYVQELLQEGPAKAGNLMHEIATKWDEDSVEAVNTWVKMRKDVAEQMRLVNIALTAWGSGLIESPVTDVDKWLEGVTQAEEILKSAEEGDWSEQKVASRIKTLAEAMGLSIEEIQTLGEGMTTTLKGAWDEAIDYIREHPITGSFEMPGVFSGDSTIDIPYPRDTNPYYYDPQYPALF